MLSVEYLEPAFKICVQVLYKRIAFIKNFERLEIQFELLQKLFFYQHFPSALNFLFKY